LKNWAAEKDGCNAQGEPGFEIMALVDVSIPGQIAAVEARPAARG
tara:strand:- start:6121 stop:6255 length:135 start_codon:yes stop_codon:yes gene_type:complete